MKPSDVDVKKAGELALVLAKWRQDALTRADNIASVHASIHDQEDYKKSFPIRGLDDEVDVMVYGFLSKYGSK